SGPRPSSPGRASTRADDARVTPQFHAFLRAVEPGFTNRGKDPRVPREAPGTDRVPERGTRGNEVSMTIRRVAELQAAQEVKSGRPKPWSALLAPRTRCVGWAPDRRRALRAALLLVATGLCGGCCCSGQPEPRRSNPSPGVAEAPPVL